MRKQNTIYTIQIANDPEVGAMIKQLADDNKRSIGNQTAILIREAYCEKYSTLTQYQDNKE